MNERIYKAIGRCNPDEPLPPGDERWTDFSRPRDFDLQETVLRYLIADEMQQRFSHIILAGHRGSGKSTELETLRRVTEKQGILTLYAQVNMEADPNEVDFGDIILLKLRLLEHAFSNPQNKLKELPDKTIARVMEWFKDVTRIEEQEIERSLEYKSKTGLGVDTPFAKLLFGLTALRRSTGKRREEIREAVAKYPDSLRENMNLLLDDARKIARDEFPRGFLFILDNLDRYKGEQVGPTILGNADLFKGIPAHTLFVVPISMLYQPVGEAISDRYDEWEVLPMLPVFRREALQSVDVDIIPYLKDAIHKRAEPDLFADPSLVDEIARLSGGCPRDLIKLLKQALLFSDEKIDRRAVEKAASKIRGEMDRLLNLEHYDVLAKVALDQRINSDENGRFLLYYRHALEYNHSRWHGVHPLLWEMREFQQALEIEKTRRNSKLAQ